MRGDQAPRRFRSLPMQGLRWFAQRCLLRPTVWRLARVTVEDVEHLHELRGAYVAVANHSSHLDAPLVVGAIPWSRVRLLATGAAADYFFDVKWRMWLTTLFFNAYPVDRTGGSRHPRLSKALLAEGCPVLLFPEGGRAKQGQGMRAFKPGAAALSIATGNPVLPIGLVGAQRAMPRGRNWPVRGREPVTVRFGAPLYPRAREDAEQFSSRIESVVADLSGQPCARRMPDDGTQDVRLGLHGHDDDPGIEYANEAPSGAGRGETAS